MINIDLALNLVIPLASVLVFLNIPLSSKAFAAFEFWHWAVGNLNKLLNKLLDDNVNIMIVELLAFWYISQ